MSKRTERILEVIRIVFFILAFGTVIFHCGFNAMLGAGVPCQKSNGEVGGFLLFFEHSSPIDPACTNFKKLKDGYYLASGGTYHPISKEAYLILMQSWRLWLIFLAISILFSIPLAIKKIKEINEKASSPKT